MKKIKNTFFKSLDVNGFCKTLNYFIQIFLIKISVQDFVKIDSITKVYLRNGTSDIPVFRQIFLEGEYKFDYGRKISAIIDAGANIGLASVYFALKFQDSKIICVEPERANFELLLKNIKSFPNIIAIQGGVWKQNGTLQIRPSDKHGEWGFQLSEINVLSNEVCVPSYTISTLMKDHGFSNVDILKIDVEGAEKEIFLEGEIGEWLPYCKHIVMEIHEFLYPGLANKILERIAKIAPFKKYQIGENTFIQNEERVKYEDICFKP